MRKMHEIIRVYDDCGSGLRFGIGVGVWVALLSAVVNIRSISNDNVPNVLIPVSLLREGNLDLSEFQAVVDGYKSTRCYWAVPTKRGLYSRYPIWAGVASTPIFAPFVAFATDGPPATARARLEASPETRDDPHPVLTEAQCLRIGRLSALIYCGIFAGALAVTARRFMPGRWAALLTVFAVLGTTLWHQLGSNLSNQTLPILCVMLVLAIVARPEMTRGRALAAGLLAGLAISARLPVVLMAAAPLGVFLSRVSWRRHLPFVLTGGAIFPILTLVYNAYAFGHPLSTGYGAEGHEWFDAPMWEGALGLLFSPTCGLLIYSPFLVLGLIAAYQCVRGRVAGETGELGRWIVLGVIGQWLLFSKWWAWNGALTYGGARMLAETIPGLMMLIAVAWPVVMRRDIREEDNQSRDRRYWYRLGATGGLTARADTGSKLPVAPANQTVPVPAGARIPSRTLTVEKHWLIIAGVFAILLYLVGTVAYDAIAPSNPTKLNWDLRGDFIALYLRRFGLVPLLGATLKQGAMLAGTFLLGGYLVGRFLDPGRGASSAFRGR